MADGYVGEEKQVGNNHQPEPGSEQVADSEALDRLTSRRPVAGDVEQRSSASLGIENRKIRGLIPYGAEARLNGFTETIAPGALANTKLDTLYVTVDHVDHGLPLARYPGSLEVRHADNGLNWAFTPPKSRPDLTEAIERGDVSGSSWRMVVADDQWNGEHRTITRIGELREITIAGSQQPAYPAAQVEYRTQPQADGQEDDMADQADKQEQEQTEDRVQEKLDNSGGLRVEDRVEVLPSSRPFVQEIAVAMREVPKHGIVDIVSKGKIDEKIMTEEQRSLTTAISLATPQYGQQLFDLLRPASAFVRSGVRTLTTDSSTLILPQLAGDPTIGWVSEAGSVPASDASLTSGTITPHKLMVSSVYSNEAAEDSAPALETVLRESLMARAGVQVDIAAYQGSGAAPEPRGMANVVGIGTVNAAGAGTSITWAQNAIALLESNYAPRPYVYTSGTSLIKDLRVVKSGTSVDSYMFPPGSEAWPTLYGATGYSAPALAAGTVHVYSPATCFVVNRTSGFEITINRFRLSNYDQSEIYLRARLDFAFPYPSAIAKGTGVP